MSCPVIPKCWENMNIPDEFKKTSDGKPFCIMEECMPGKSSIIWGFASESGLEVMKTSPDWHIDATFEVMGSTLFSQLFVVVCRVNKVSIPCAFFCMPSKEYQAYKMVMDCLVQRSVLQTGFTWTLKQA